MKKIDQLKIAISLHGIAHLLGFKPSTLAYILYKLPDSEKYTIFSIPKRQGGSRIITSPCPKLKNVQQRLSVLLQDCIDEINSANSRTNKLSHGFRRKKSIITNSMKHRNKNYVFNIDLDNFFGEINFGRVRGYFIKNRDFELNPTIATILAQICCFNDYLPQGSPSSPVISNLIGHIIDIRLAKLAYKSGCHYSRYVDDLTFSTNKNTFPAKIAIKDKQSENHWLPGKSLENILNKSGFSINQKKTRMQYRTSRQEVTGLVVNSKVNTRPEYWRTARAMAHTLFKSGSYTRKVTKTDTNGNIIEENIVGTIEQLNGILNFINQLDKHNNRITYQNSKRRDSKTKAIPHNSREITYRNFLYYKYFFAAKLPILLTEGKTDYTYIKFSLLSLFKNHPKLAEQNPKGKVNIKLSAFKYSKTTDYICNLSGGSNQLAKFIYNYKKISSVFLNHPKAPVIILIDNDSGSKTIFSAIKQVTNSKHDIDGNAPFYHVYKNIYVVPIPKLNNKDTSIEDYFDKNTLRTTIRGKSFSKKNEFETKQHYGKHVFSTEVVSKNYTQINFNKFNIILDNITQAIVHFQST
ncbi:MAG: retron Ec67 family RNA-directed DNA polymerase/endonuclease [Candidatus Thiodiazotropha sp. L084R]